MLCAPHWQGRRLYIHPASRALPLHPATHGLLSSTVGWVLDCWVGAGGLAGFLLPQETTGMQLQQDVPTIEEDGEDDSQPLGSARVLRSDGRYQPATSALEIENYGEEY
jgi:hypothetical protein